MLTGKTTIPEIIFSMRQNILDISSMLPGVDCAVEPKEKPVD